MLNKLFISALLVSAGFVSAYILYADKQNEIDDSATAQTNPVINISNPFKTSNENEIAIQKIANESLSSRISQLEDQYSLIQIQLDEMQRNIRENTEQKTALYADGSSLKTNRASANRATISALNRRLYKLDRLIKGGIDPAFAEDFVRRKNAIELQRLALYDKATREHYQNTDRYFAELAVIDKEDVSLRDELGDDRFDQYLYDSKQNNRIKISSVMLGSAAEEVGILPEDIILNYNNQRMFNWQELRDATAKGELGEYIPVTIYRGGQIFTFSVPRGPLGVQLSATRLEP